MTVLILGGGIGGLSAAHYILKNKTHNVLLLEASNRVGGWIRSNRHDCGVILEQGPRTLRPRGKAGANTLNLIEELGLGGKIRPIKSSSTAAKNRFIYVNGQLHKLPSSLPSLFRTNPPFSKPLVRILLSEWRNKANYVEDDSIYNFVKRRFGSEIAEFAISPLICGICGGDAKRISVKFLLSNFFDKEQKYGSITKSYLRPSNWNLVDFTERGNLATRAKRERWSSYCFSDGLELLPQTLRTQVESAGGIIKTECSAISLDLRQRILKTKDDKIKFDFVVSALPAASLAKLLYDDHFEIAHKLLQVQETSIVTVNLVYKTKLLDIEGFGFLIPPSENLPVLGVIFDHSYAPVNDWTVLTVMMGGHAFEKYFARDQNEQYMLATALENVSKILKIKQAPDVQKVSILRNCIPQHVVGHSKRMTWVRNQVASEKFPLYLVGNTFEGTGINDVILTASKAAEAVSDYGKPEECGEKQYEIDYL